MGGCNTKLQRLGCNTFTVIRTGLKGSQAKGLVNPLPFVRSELHLDAGRFVVQPSPRPKGRMVPTILRLPRKHPPTNPGRVFLRCHLHHLGKLIASPDRDALGEKHHDIIKECKIQHSAFVQLGSKCVESVVPRVQSWSCFGSFGEGHKTCVCFCFITKFRC